MQTIVVVAGDPGGANALAPVIEALLRDPEVDLHPFAYNEACTLWKNRGISYVPLPETPRMDYVTKTLMTHKAGVILLATSHNVKEFEKYFVTAARELRIPTLSVLDFWSFYSVRFNNREGRLAYLPDRIAVMDERAESEMIREGIKPELLTITGQPAFDELQSWKCRYNLENRNKIRRDLDISDNDLMVIFASEPEVDTGPGDPFFPGYKKDNVIRTLVQVLDEISHESGRDIVLVIRPHPRENARDFDKYKTLPVRVEISESDHSRNIVMAADLVTGMTTNLLVEACYLGCIVVSLQPGLCLQDPMITNQSGHSVGLFDEKDFKPVIQKLLLNFATRKEMKDRLETFQTDGKAVQRIVTVIHDLMKTS
jgi:hypothetical protein